MASAHTLLEILTSIEAAVSNKQVMEAYSVGINTLKEVNKGVTPEKVEDLMDTLRDTLADQKEIDNALAGNVTDVDDAEIEEELNKLVEDEEAEKAKQKEASAAAAAVVVSTPAKVVPATPHKVVENENQYALTAEEEKDLSELMGGMQVGEEAVSAATPQKKANEKRVVVAE